MTHTNLSCFALGSKCFRIYVEAKSYSKLGYCVLFTALNTVTNLYFLLLLKIHHQYSCSIKVMTAL